MDSTTRLQRLFRLGIAVAATLLVAAAVLLVFRKGQYDQLELEYAAVREASALVERYVETGAVGDLPDGVTGFGVYDLTGQGVTVIGSAPASIRPPAAGDEIQRRDGQLRLLRPIGGRLPASPQAGARGQRRAAPGAMAPGGSSGGSSAHYFVVLDYDISGTVGRRRLENAALVGSGALTAAVLVLVTLLYRRLQRAQRAQQDQARLAQLGEAARTLAHEIKNPLTAAQMQTALLRRTVPTSDHGRLAVLDEELARIRTLTDQVRDFLKSGAGSPVEIDPAVVARTLAERLPFPVVVYPPESPVAVSMDPERFRSALTNLLENAAHASQAPAAATDAGPGEERPAPPVEVTIRRHRDRVEIIVADRGPGIPPGDRSRVFDPFFTTKTHGSGVGLAVSRQFVEQAGGTIEARERSGGGTEMIMRLKGTTHERAHR